MPRGKWVKKKKKETESRAADKSYNIFYILIKTTFIGCNRAHFCRYMCVCVTLWHIKMPIMSANVIHFSGHNHTVIYTQHINSFSHSHDSLTIWYGTCHSGFALDSQFLIYSLNMVGWPHLNHVIDPYICVVGTLLF